MREVWFSSICERIKLDSKRVSHSCESKATCTFPKGIGPVLRVLHDECKAITSFHLALEHAAHYIFARLIQESSSIIFVLCAVTVSGAVGQAEREFCFKSIENSLPCFVPHSRSLIGLWQSKPEGRLTIPNIIRIEFRKLNLKMVRRVSHYLRCRWYRCVYILVTPSTSATRFVCGQTKVSIIVSIPIASYGIGSIPCTSLVC
mmetsp:Transcript_6680/g.11043  ORF Transcript_6680/g.11043 Transcript_6680/m.11043 type:complete len:203 (+) Transcript_6680:756-1364(+)